MLKILLALVIFGILVLIHEFGHFIVAKLCNIKVNKFAVGMGPCILKKQKAETEYSLRALPVGGFCAMEGEEEESDNERAFGNKSVWQRMAVIIAGPFMNVLLGFVLIIVTTCMSPYVPTNKIAGFHTVSESDDTITASSYEAGLREGDVIIKMNGMRLWSQMDLLYELSSTNNESFDLVVKRNGEKVELNNVSFKDTETGEIIDFYIKGEKKNPVNVVIHSAKQTASTARLIWISLIDLLSGKYGVQDMSGPVGLVNAIGDAATSGVSMADHINSLLNLTIFITVNLGIFNLLPIPGLDGGRLLFLIIEGVRRKKISPEHEGMINLIGLGLVMLLIVVVTFSDIKKLIM